MPIPTYPANFLPRPFADSGNKTIIPDTNAGSGRASFVNGWPTETQLPLNQGGVPPNRLDFNGINYLTTALLFWQQSGGQAIYNTTLNYTTPMMAYYASGDIVGLWWCLRENGPDSANGLHTPGNEADVDADGNPIYWDHVFNVFQEFSTGRARSGGVPVGTIIMYYHKTLVPEGYFACNGGSFSATEYPELREFLGSTTLPDLRGYFLRGADTRNTVDPNGTSRVIGTAQNDAGRNITAEWSSIASAGQRAPTGAVSYASNNSGSRARYEYNGSPARMAFSAQASWGAAYTAAEFRPKNKIVNYCIKHD